MTPERQIYQGQTAEPIQETITFASAQNLTAATLQFVYKAIDDDEVVRSATIVSASPSTAAATSAVVRRSLTTTDVSEVGFYGYQWKLTLADETVIKKPDYSATKDTMTPYPSRRLKVFEVIESLSVQTAESEEDGTVVVGTYMVVENLTELAGLPWTEVYELAWVLTDLNGILSAWAWDATIVTANAVPNSVVPLTDARGGGWRRTSL